MGSMLCCVSSFTELDDEIDSQFTMQLPTNMPVSDDYDYSFKIVFSGDKNTGKTALIARYEEDKFIGKYSPTIGIEFSTHEHVSDTDARIKLSIWDANGDDDSIHGVYFQNCHGILLVYDVTSQKSFNHLKQRLIEFEQNIDEGQHVIKMVVGNKIDKDEKRVIDYQTGQLFANSIGAQFIEVSCLTGQNVELLFQGISDLMEKHFKQFV